MWSPIMSKKITFQELIDALSDKTNQSHQFSHDFLKGLVSVINEGLEEEGKVNLSGFGKFELRWMDEREGFNPQTGERMSIPAHSKVVFKPYKGLREQVNTPYAHLESSLIDESDDEASKTFKRNAFIASVMVLLLVVITLGIIGTGSEENSSEKKIADTPLQTKTEQTVATNSNSQSNQQQSQATEKRSEVSKAKPAESTPKAVTYTVQEGDKLWKIAEKKLNDPYLWPWIYSNNTKTISDPDVIQVGSKLQLPTPNTMNGHISSADSADVAVAYVKTYKTYKKHNKDHAKFYLWAAKRYDKDVFNKVETTIDADDLAIVNQMKPKQPPR